MPPGFDGKTIVALEGRSRRQPRQSLWQCTELSLLWNSTDQVKTGNHFGWKLYCCSSEILAKMLDRRCPRDQQDVERALQQPGECYLHWGSLQGGRRCVKCRRLQRSEASQRKERHIGYALPRKVIDKAVVIPVSHVVKVLHADNLGNRLTLCHLSGADVAQAEMTNQSLTLKLRQHGQRLFDRPLGWPQHGSHPEIDDIQCVESKISQIVMNSIDQLLTRKRMNPRFVHWPASTDFGDDHQSIWIRMKRLFDDLVGHMRAVKIAGIDVVDPCRNSLSENSYCSVNITRRSPNLRTGKLHGAVAHSLQTYRSTGKCEAAAKIYLFRHFVSPLVVHLGANNHRQCQL